MTDNRRPSSHDCPPAPEYPAPQPKPPSSGSDCPKIEVKDPPKLEPPAACPPDPCCKCPTTPPSDPNCLADLIAAQAADIARADKATKFKAELDDLLKQAKLANQKYTRTKYEDLVKAWVELDKDIAILISRLVCIVPCWRCVIECYICPLIEQLRHAELWLYDKDHLYTDVYDLYDLRYWHERDRQIKERRLGRIDKVLAQWTKPGETIEATIKANKDLHTAVSTSMGTDPGRAVYDVFLKLVPRHLAIAPPKNSGWTTRIDQQYLEFCKCDQGESDDCCGPDVGKLSIKQRLVGPLPYLIDPNDYYTLICCLVEKRLRPAKEALWKADSDLAAVNERITQQTAKFGADWVKTFETDVKGAIPGVIDCCDFDPREGGPRTATAR